MSRAGAKRFLVTYRLIEVVLVSLFPISIIKIGLMPSLMRYIVLIGIAAFAGGSILFKKWTRNDLGVTKDVFIYWRVYLICTIIAVAVVVAVHRLLDMPYVTWQLVTVIKLVVISFLISCIQEFLYRSYLFRLFKDITGDRDNFAWVGIVFNIVAFTYMHTIFPNLGVILPLTGVGGILFAILYHYYRNIYLVSGMHFVLNFTALYLGFFPVALLKFI